MQTVVTRRGGLEELAAGSVDLPHQTRQALDVRQGRDGGHELRRRLGQRSVELRELWRMIRQCEHGLENRGRRDGESGALVGFGDAVTPPACL